jgi:hypothetical protein
MADGTADDDLGPFKVRAYCGNKVVEESARPSHDGARMEQKRLKNKYPNRYVSIRNRFDHGRGED